MPYDVFQLVKLKVHNFWLFEDVELDFSQLPLGSVIYVDAINYDAVDAKSNWTGKSTLMLDAFEWCIYGNYKRLRKVNEVIGLFDKYTMVSLVYKNKQHTVEITRYRKHPKFGNRFDLILDGEPLVRERLKENVALLNDIFHMDIKQYRHGVLFNTEAQNLLELNPAPRLKLLTEIWQLGMYDQATKIANKKVSELNRRLIGIKHSLESAEAIKNELQETISEYEDLDREFENIKTNKIKELEEEIEHLTKRYERRNDLDAQLQNLFKELKKRKRRLSKIKLILDKIELSRIKHGDVSKAVSKLQRQKSEIQGQIKLLNKKKNKLTDEMKAHIGSRCEYCGSTINNNGVKYLVSQINKEIADLQIEIDNIMDRMQVVKTNVSFDFEGLNVYIPKYQSMDIATIEIKMRQIYHKYKEKISELERTISSIKDELIRIEESQDTIDKLKKKIVNIQNSKSPYKTKLMQRKKKMQGILDKIHNLEEAHTDTVHDLNLYVFWSNKNTGFSKMRNIILSSNIETFAKEFNMHLNAITEGSITANWVLNEGATKIDCKLYDSVTLREKHYMGFSSAQRAKLNCAIDFAMSKVCAPTVGHINIDERLDHIDNTGLIHIVKYLRTISSSFNKTVFIISHAMTSFDPFDAVVRIERKGNRSVAELKILRSV